MSGSASPKETLVPPAEPRALESPSGLPEQTRFQTPDLRRLTLSETRARPLAAGAVREPGSERNCRAEPRVRARSFRGRGRGRTCARRFLPSRSKRWRWWHGGCGSGGPPQAAGLPGVSYQRPWGRGGRLRGRCLFRLGPRRVLAGSPAGLGGGRRRVFKAAAPPGLGVQISGR